MHKQFCKNTLLYGYSNYQAITNDLLVIVTKHRCIFIYSFSEANDKYADIADVIEINPSVISDECKYSLINNRTLGKLYKFPPKLYKDNRKKSGEMKRYCIYEWFQDYKFISYSKSTDGLLCLACVFLPIPAHQGAKTKSLIKQP